LLILGMPRTGTTLVEQILSSHPAVAAGGELPFWNQAGVPLTSGGIEERIAAEAAGIAAAYRTELDRIAPAALRVTDKNPYNFHWIGLIHLIFPNARIIHCLRDPVDTCLSIYTTLFGAGADRPCERGDLVFYYRAYQRLMAHWHAALPAGTILDVQYEDLIAHPEDCTRRIVAHSGLDWDPACLAPEANTRVVRTASIFQARQPIYRSSLQRWRRYEPWLGALRDLLPEDAEA
jgi:hypothetical protein